MPNHSRTFAESHDANIWQCLRNLINIHEDDAVASQSQQIAQLPLRLGGLGLRCAKRIAVAASWASWTDSLHMMQQRHPELANQIVSFLDPSSDSASIFEQLQEGRSTLVNEGFTQIPTWQEAADGIRPPVPAVQEPGEWQHGWQFYAADARETYYRSNTFLPSLDRTQQALLRSQSGPASGAAFIAIPTNELFTFSSQIFRVMLLRRLRLPLPNTDRR